MSERWLGNDAGTSHAVDAGKMARRRATEVSAVFALASQGHADEAVALALELVGRAEHWSQAAVWWTPRSGARHLVARWSAPDAGADARDDAASMVMVPLSLAGVERGTLGYVPTAPAGADPSADTHVAAIAAMLALRLGQAEATLERRRLDARLDQIASDADVALFEIDASGEVGAMNGGAAPAIAAWFSDNALTALPASQATGAALRRALAGEASTAVAERPGSSGRWFHMHLAPVFTAGQVVGVTGIAVDVTASLKEREHEKRSQLRQSETQRLISLGTLASGVAHEVNNPLTYVRINLGRLISLERRDHGTGPEHLHRLELLQEAREGVERVAQIVSDLRAFSQPRAPTGGDVIADLDAAIQGALRLAEHHLRHRARVVTGGEPGLMAGVAHGRLAQVLLNLLLNAAEAIPDGEAARNEVRLRTFRDAEGRVCIEVSDTGAGIPAEQLPRVFDPFFTARPSASIGLGLFVCRSLIDEAGGEITVESAVGRGTQVKLVLPAPRRAVARPARRALGTVPPREATRGRVLVIDDDRGVAASLATLIGGEHETRVAGSGREALELLARDAEFDVILCDLMMADQSGIDVYEHLKAHRPALAERVVFMTGGATSERSQRFVSASPRPCLEKPFDEETLLGTLRSLVDARHPGPTDQPSN